MDKKEPKITQREIDRMINERIKEKHGITNAQLKRLINKQRVPKKRKTKIEVPKNEFKFGIVTDTHLSSTLCALDELHSFYEIMKKQGVKHVMHSGDLVAGNGRMFRGQEMEMSAFGLEAQAQDVIDNYPKIKGMTTHVIAGNHDLSFFNDNGGDLIKNVAHERDDFNYVGHYDATVSMGGVKIKLLHPDKGGGANITAKSNGMVDAMEEKDKPDIFILGHWHTNIYYRYKGVNVIHGGCWERESDYLIRKGISTQIGGWIVTVKTNAKGKLLSITPEWYNFA